MIFPTSDEHRRELDFFFNTLMSEAFTQDYFEEVYVYQFMKIIKSLLKQLFELKNLKTQNMELISIFEVRERLKKDSKKPIKVIFVPIIFEKEDLEPGIYFMQVISENKLIANQKLIIQ